MVRNIIKNFPRDFHGIVTLLNENPRMPKCRIAKRLGINEKTAADWMDIAFDQRIIISPILRLKSFLNFREYFYFLKVKDPSLVYKKLKKNRNISYYAVLTGFANFEIISHHPINPPGDIILSGERSDYYVAVPPKWSLDESIRNLRKKLNRFRSIKPYPSPLLYHDTIYEPWDREDEILYWEFNNDMRRKLTHIMKDNLISSTKALKWLRRMREFGTPITMFFPRGEEAYLPSIFAIKTKKDYIFIELFSKLPASSVFYRLGDCLMMIVYLPLAPAVSIFVRDALSKLSRGKVIESYDNANIEYSYRF